MATLPSDLQNELPDGELPEGMSVRIASLTDEGQQQVIDALYEAQGDGELTEESFQDAVGNAESADESRENVENLRTDQAEAVESGDFAKAQDLANQSEYELREVDDLGGTEAEQEVLEAQTDQQELADAGASQEAAEENADFAMSDRGTEGQREAAAETAADYSADAAQSASQADAGGTYGDHSYSASANDVPAAEDSAGTDSE
jgi:hypothetical protein